MGYVFVTLDFPGCCDNVTVDPNRRKVTEIARRWSGLLASTGMDAAAQVWKDNQLAFETKHENHVKEITDYCMMQPETAMVRWNMEAGREHLDVIVPLTSPSHRPLPLPC